MKPTALSLAAAALAAAVVAVSLPALATQVSAPEAARVDGPAVVAQVRRIIAERYVLPERRPALDAILAKGLASGRYDVTEPGTLAARINADLDTAGHDRHLNFAYNPAMAAQLSARSAPAPDLSGYERQVRGANHGVTALRVLPGNVRYLKYDGFMWIGPESAAALETAMRFLAGGEAVIIDLRSNGGGSPDAVQYIISHFLPADRPLVTFYMNGEPAPDKLATLGEVPAGRMLGKPLYVLTSGGTGSAAEEFTGHVAGYRLGELVGATTAGAGFRNDLIAIPGGYVLSVSVGRAVLASTGKDWEAVGFAPTIRSDVAGALDVAHAHALRRLAAAAPADEKAQLEAVAEAVAARGERRAPALPLSAYAGVFGERAISVDNGQLYYQRGPRARIPLIALGGNAFAFDTEPETRLQFRPEGQVVTAIEIGSPGQANPPRYERTR